MAAANPLNEKARNLPLLCVETICKFTPTSKLVQLYSHVVPLPGASWELGVDTVLRKRLPFSLGADPLYHQADDPTAIFDAAGAKVGCVKEPKALRVASIAEFIVSATLTARATQWYGGLQLFVSHGQALFSVLPRITKLYLVLCKAWGPLEMIDLLEPNLKHLLPQLETLVIRLSSHVHNKTQMDQIVVSFVKLLPVRDMAILRRLELPEDAFCQATRNNSADQHIFSGLSTVGVLLGDSGFGTFPRRRVETRNFVATYCRQVTTFAVVVHGEFKAYLDAFHALPDLNTLCLDLDYDIRFEGLAFDGNGAISSVLDLRIMCKPYSDGTNVLKVSTFFPNVTAVALQANHHPDSLQLATSLFGARQIFPAVAKLSCSFTGEIFSCWIFTQFLANPHLPEVVDISQIVFDHLVRDAKLLTAVYCAMQTSSIKKLLLRGLVHHEALPRLQSRIELNGESAKVSAWRDRDLGDQPGVVNFAEISEQTDFKIIGTKTSGCLKGEQFTIRVFHQLAKRVNIFD